MIITFLTDSEKEFFSSVLDKDLNKLFQEVRKDFDGKLYLQTIEIIKRKGFLGSTKIVEILYILYTDTGNGSEVQVINFCRDWQNSLNLRVPKSYIVTYFYGLLAGRHSWCDKIETACPDCKKKFNNWLHEDKGWSALGAEKK